MNIMREAHKMTKEIKKEYPGVDYKFQLGLCMSFLYEQIKEEKITFEVIKAKMDEAVQEVGVVDWSCNKWKKGKYDRTYLTLFWYKGGRKEIKCGYWDNITNEYITKDRYTRIYDVVNKEYV